MHSGACRRSVASHQGVAKTGEGAMGNLIVAAAIAIFAMVIISKIARVVPQQQAWVIERLGKYSTTLHAGFHILVPFLDVVRYKHSLKENALDVPEQICITKDNV